MARQKNPAPTNKVLASTAGAAVGTILVWVLAQSGLNVTDGVELAITTLMTFILGYVTPPGARDAVEGDPVKT